MFKGAGTCQNPVHKACMAVHGGCTSPLSNAVQAPSDSVGMEIFSRRSNASEGGIPSYIWSPMEHAYISNHRHSVGYFFYKNQYHI